MTMTAIEHSGGNANSDLTEAQLVRAIKAHIERGDKAKDKADQHYIAAGQHLKTLKDQHAGSWAEWEALLKDRIGIGKSRASELMQIADGRRTVEETKADTAKRVARHRESSPLRNGESRDLAVVEQGDVGEGGDAGVVSPEEFKDNILFSLERQKAIARAYKKVLKVLKVSSLDEAMKDEISAAIGGLITILQSLQRALAKPRTEPRDDGPDISASLRRTPGSTS
jgi:hypothetical protein